ncbi:O-antigen ligase family protein [Pseudobacteriovorax antillogorgiicola]|nr:O-antigen ligase family protein [Pseudobacteriovorax antillogorgiicola]
MSYVCIYFFNRLLYRYSSANTIALIISIFLVLGTYSRGAQGTVITGLIIASFIRFIIGVNSPGLLKLKLSGFYLFGVTIGSLSLLGHAFLPKALTQRIYNIFNWTTETSNVNRFGSWKGVIGTLENWQDWLFGRSLGTYGNALSYFDLPVGVTLKTVTESYYLKILAETGLLGLFLFMCIIISAGYHTYRSYCLSNNIETKVLASFCFSALFAHGIELLFLQSLESTSVGFIFMYTLAISSSISSKAEYEAKYGG